MGNRQATFLGLKQLPRELTAFEIEAFFTFTLAERQLIEDRRRPALKLGLALQIGFLRMCGRLLDAVRMVPPALWRHLGAQFGVAAPDLASLRAMYRRAPTLIEHQQLACEALGFHWLSESQRRALVLALRQELARTRDRQRLLVFARRWLYDHQLIITHERSLRSTIVSATRQYEAALAKSIHAGIDSDLLERWRQALVTLREAGLSQQSWLWAAPAKHSPRQIEELLERIETLYELGVHRHLVDVPDDLLRRYARRLANRPPSIGARIKEPVRTIETAYFLRYCLLIGTDRVLLMVRRRVADLWRRAAKDANQVLIHWADLYRELLASLGALASASPWRKDRRARASRASFDASNGIYGSPRVFLDLREAGETCSKHRVARLMRAHKIRAVRGYSRKPKSGAKPSDLVPNVLQRQFDVGKPNCAWVTDITYIRTWEGWLYLAVVLDLFSRRIVGWAVAPTIGRGLVLDAVLMAVRRRRPRKAIIHSDQGSQYGSDDWLRFCKTNGLVPSMSRRGNCWDNAVAESFFSSLKKEHIKKKIYKNRSIARDAIAEYIEAFYNPTRRHSHLGGVSPAAFEAAGSRR